MLASLKFPEPRGIDAKTDYYGFYVRTAGSMRERLLEARERVAKRYGAPPSNALLLHELLAAFAGPESSRGL